MHCTIKNNGVFSLNSGKNCNSKKKSKTRLELEPFPCDRRLIKKVFKAKYEKRK